MSQLTKFLHHTPCEHCGSSDAKAMYSDGSAFCFSCKKLTRGTVSGYVLAKATDDTSTPIRAPADIGFEYSTQALEWVDQFGLSAADLIKNKVYWSLRFNQLLYIYQYYDRAGIGLIQGRNFTPGRPKYFNIGDVNQVMPIYHYGTPESHASTLVLVEDTMSAIKIARDGFRDSMPILGSGITLMKISKLPNMGYKRVIVWLDHDKYKEALRISQQIRMSGADSFVVTTDLDPKYYATPELLSRLKHLC